MQPTENTTGTPAPAKKHHRKHNSCICSLCRPPRPALPEGTRRNTVSYLSPSGGDIVPFIRLRGQWLEKAGFCYGDQILGKVEHNRITIDLESPYDGNAD